jgi:hypothetical protein
VPVNIGVQVMVVQQPELMEHHFLILNLKFATTINVFKTALRLAISENFVRVSVDINLVNESIWVNKGN